MIRTPERVTCDICGRYGDVGFRSGTKPDAWICIVRKTCNRRLWERQARERRAARIAPKGPRP